MKMPGFTAEASLYNAFRHYQSANFWAGGSMAIIPQVMKADPFDEEPPWRYKSGFGSGKPACCNIKVIMPDGEIVSDHDYCPCPR